MRRILLFIFVTVVSIRCFGQANNTFDIREVYITDSGQLKYPSDFNTPDSIFFQDEKFIVRATCNGEWGGSVWFKNKKTKKVYSCRATCPAYVNKIGNKYYVTTNSYHMMTSTGVIEIDNPEFMEIFDSVKAKTKSGDKLRTPYGQFQSNSIKGTKYLADTTDSYTIKSFIYSNKLYHLMSESFIGGKVYIATNQDKRFITIDTIPGGGMYNISSKIFEKNGHLLIFFYKTKIVEAYMSKTYILNGCLRGYIDIFENKITIYRYEKLLGEDKNCR